MTRQQTDNSASSIVDWKRWHECAIFEAFCAAAELPLVPGAIEQLIRASSLIQGENMRGAVAWSARRQACSSFSIAGDIDRPVSRCACDAIRLGAASGGRLNA